VAWHIAILAGAVALMRLPWATTAAAAAASDKDSAARVSPQHVTQAALLCAAIEAVYHDVHETLMFSVHSYHGCECGGCSERQAGQTCWERQQPGFYERFVAALQGGIIEQVRPGCCATRWFENLGHHASGGCWFDLVCVARGGGAHMPAARRGSSRGFMSGLWRCCRAASLSR
jgi:hypothetical protein